MPWKRKNHIYLVYKTIYKWVINDLVSMGSHLTRIREKCLIKIRGTAVTVAREVSAP